MNQMILMILAVAFITLLILPLLATALCLWRKRNHGLAINVGEGTHESGCVTRRADAVISTRHLLVKIGSDAAHIAVTAAVTDIPLGVVPDEAEAIEDPVHVRLLGCSPGTVKMVANAEITAGALVTVGAAGGKVAPLPAGAGTYYIVGRALTYASGDGAELEVAPCFPTQRVVAG